MSWRFELQPQLAPQDSPSLRGDSLRRIGVGNSAVPSSISIQIAGLSRSLVCIRRAQKLGEGTSAEVHLCQHQGRNGTTCVLWVCPERVHGARRQVRLEESFNLVRQGCTLLRILLPCSTCWSRWESNFQGQRTCRKRAQDSEEARSLRFVETDWIQRFRMMQGYKCEKAACEVRPVWWILILILDDIRSLEDGLRLHHPCRTWYIVDIGSCQLRTCFPYFSQ